jgi:hypothetical protein
MALDVAASFFWEGVEYLGELTVIIACVGEYLAEFRHFPKNPVQRKRFERRCVKLLIGGLAIGLIGLFKTTELSKLEIAILRTDLANANERAQKLELARWKLKQEVETVNDLAILAHRIAARSIEQSTQLRSSNASLAMTIAQLQSDNANLDNQVQLLEEKLARSGSNIFTRLAETRSDVYRLDPRKHPITSVSAIVQFNARGPNVKGSRDSRGESIPSKSSFYWGKFPDITIGNGFRVFLVSDTLHRTNRGSFNYSMEFHSPQQSGPGSWNGFYSDSVETADEWDAMFFENPSFPSISEVLDGSITITINSSTTKTFPIPQQRCGSWITSRIQGGEASDFLNGARKRIIRK